MSIVFFTKTVSKIIDLQVVQAFSYQEIILTFLNKPNMRETIKKIQALRDTIQRLLGKDGCPWDKKQTNRSLLKYFHSECIELDEAISKNDYENICEELGDILYILLMFAEINSSNGYFNLSDVVTGIDEKLIRRHPHVFAGTTYANEEELAVQWQAIKAEEKKKNSV